MPALLTQAGTWLCADADGLIHAPAAEDARVLIVRRNGDMLRFAMPDGQSRSVTWERDAAAGNALRLRGPDGFLYATADGLIRHDGDADQKTGLFLLLADNQYGDLCYLAAHRWAMQVPLARMLPPQPAALCDNFVLRLCGRDVPLDRPDIAFPRVWRLSTQNPGEVVFQYGAALAGRARLYNPLIYLCVAGDDLVLSMLELFLDSLATFGGYDGRIVIMADRDAMEIARVTPAALRPNTSVLKLNFNTKAEAAAARYRVAGQTFADHQPILYADPQVIVTSAVVPLLTDLLQQDGVCFASAYHDTRKTQTVPEETQNAYGGLLFAADPDWSGRVACVHPGLIGFTRIAEADRVFPLILSVAARHAAQPAASQPAQPGGLQAAASYVAQKAGHAQPDFLNRYAQILSHNQPDPAVRHFSLVHFNHAANLPRKLDMMRRFMDALRERGDAPATPAGPTAVTGII